MMQRADRVELSVVVPVKNGLPWLREQLEAPTRQRCCLDWEIVVANDGSTDRTEELVKEFAANDHRITFGRRVPRQWTSGHSERRSSICPRMHPRLL
jgi:glycosyltransferase involved in cell wall biosynthesis